MMSAASKSQPVRTQQGPSSSTAKAAGAALPRTEAPSGAALPRTEDGDAQSVASDSARTSLHHLNTTSAKLAHWDVQIANAHQEEYEYTWEGQARTTRVFRCHLVYVHDPEQYCMAELRKTKTAPSNW